MNVFLLFQSVTFAYAFVAAAAWPRPSSPLPVTHNDNFDSAADIGSAHLDRDTLLGAIGSTDYESAIIYEVVALRNFINKNNSLKLVGNKNIFTQLDDKKSKMLKERISPKSLKDFLDENKEVFGVNEKNRWQCIQENEEGLEQIFNQTENSRLYGYLQDLEGVNAKIVAIEDQFQDDELVYAIAINKSRKRVSLVFRGSVVKGIKRWITQDWFINFDLLPKFVKDLALEKKSEYFTFDDVNKVSDVKVHRGFAKYLFDDLGKENKESPVLYREYYSKFDEIVATLESIYKETDKDGNLKYSDYQLVITGHSLGGALAQLMTFVVASSEKCRNMFPKPILGITYASPHVGNLAFSKRMETLEEENIARHVRITNEGDIVPVGFFWFTQSGCNFHLRDNKEMEILGFGNTKNHLLNQLRISRFRFKSNSFFCHLIPFYDKNLFLKKDGINVNAKIWNRNLVDCFTAVKEGKDLSEVPDSRLKGIIIEPRRSRWFHGRNLRIVFLSLPVANFLFSQRIRYT